MQIGQSGSHVVEQFPALFLRHALAFCDIFEGRTVLDEGHDEIGHTVPTVKVGGAQQVGVIHVKHHRELLCENLDAVVIKACSGCIDFDSNLNVCHVVFGKPDFCESASAQLSD